MGYTTEFEGELLFTRPITVPELAYIKELFWIDDSDIKSRGLLTGMGKPHYVQFEFNADFTGIKWDGSEKFYNAVEAVNFIIQNIKKEFGLGLTGQLLADGEESGDVWILAIGEDGWAKRLEIPKVGESVTCPHCEETFNLEPNNDQ